MALDRDQIARRVAGALALVQLESFGKRTIRFETGRLAKQAAGIRKKLVQILVKDPEPLMFHAEVVRRNGVVMGYVRAASYGHTLGGAVGLAMIERADEPITQGWLDAGTWDVEIAGARHPCTVSLKPMYDPDNARIKA